MLTRDDIVNVSDIKTEVVSVPEWGGDVLIRPMAGDVRDFFEQSLAKEGTVNLVNIRAKLCALTLVDEAGDYLFCKITRNAKGELVDCQMDDIVLGNKSAKALDRIFAKSQRLSGVSKDDIKEYEKNL